MTVYVVYKNSPYKISTDKYSGKDAEFENVFQVEYLAESGRLILALETESESVILQNVEHFGVLP